MSEEQDVFVLRRGRPFYFHYKCILHQLFLYYRLPKTFSSKCRITFGENSMVGKFYCTLNLTEFQFLVREYYGKI